MDHIIFQTFKTTLSTLLKKHETKANNPPVQIYTNKFKKRTVLKIITDYQIS